MAHVLVKHKVNDYEAWKLAFDSFAEFRKKSGEKSFRIMHPSDSPNDLTLIFEWDNHNNAEKFMQSTELKQAMENAGVTEAPMIQFLNLADKGAF